MADDKLKMKQLLLRARELVTLSIVTLVAIVVLMIAAVMDSPSVVVAAMIAMIAISVRAVWLMIITIKE